MNNCKADINEIASECFETSIKTGLTLPSVKENKRSAVSRLLSLNVLNGLSDGEEPMGYVLKDFEDDRSSSTMARAILMPEDDFLAQINKYVKAGWGQLKYTILAASYGVGLDQVMLRAKELGVIE